MPMLERVGNQVIVNPDPRLRRTAKRRGWPVQDWSQALVPTPGIGEIRA
jgi:phosphoserine phosphatase